MKKKVNVFGKSVPVLLLVLLGVGLVSAALTGYIANVVSGEVEVKAPIQQWVSLTEDTWATGESGESITFGIIHGGQSITTYGKSENLAGTEITGETNFIVTSPPVTVDNVEYKISCEDFESVTVSFKEVGGTWTTPFELTTPGYCFPVSGEENTAVEFVNPLGSTHWDVEQVYLTKTVVTFETDALGTYTFTSSITPEI